MLLVSSKKFKIKALKLGGNIWDAVKDWSALKKILIKKKNWGGGAGYKYYF